MMKKKPNLKLEIPSSHDEKYPENNQLNNFKEKNSFLHSSIEITTSQAIFKTDDFIVDSHCIKKISTGELLTNSLNSKEIEVNYFFLE